MPLRHLFQNRDLSSPSSDTTLQVETLEDRNMLSTVLIGASGDLGGENMQVFVDDHLQLDVTLEQNIPGVFSITTDSQVELQDIRIQFTNDDYRPELGIDSNLRVNFIRIDGINQPIDTDATYSTGTWLAADGVSPGFGRGTVLHANGFLQFNGGRSTSLEFRGDTWTSNQIFTPSQAFVNADGGLVINGQEGPFSLSREVAIQPGENLFSVEAYRDVISGSFASDNAPWATAGINFYNFRGELASQETIEINSGFQTPGDTQEKTVIVPADIATAYMWIWVDGTDHGTNIPLNVSDISFEPVDTSGDTTPPLAFFQTTVIQSPPGNEINFLITFQDDRLLASPGAGAAPNAIRVTGLNGFEATAVQRTGTSDFSDTRQGIIYGLLKPDGSDWTAADNDAYTLFLEEGSLVDAAGNVAPPKRFFNQLFVDIA
jgi:hypothetical protein